MVVVRVVIVREKTTVNEKPSLVAVILTLAVISEKILKEFMAIDA